MIDFHQWFQDLGTGLRCAIDGLCPILGTVNLHRRNTDTGNSSNAIKSILVRAAASAVVAIVLGIASGLFSAYLMVQIMEVRLDGVDARVTQETADRKQLEGRFNTHVERRAD